MALRTDSDIERRSSNASAALPRPSEDSVIARRRSLDSIRPRETATRVTAARNLKWIDVASLIVNKMIGTGIFTGPFLTIQATQNKGLTMAYWCLGFIYTVLSMCLYLEYARDLPYTGGELVYLDHTWGKIRSSSAWKGIRLLAYTLYSFYFVILYTTTTNSMQFAHQVLIASDVNRNVADPDRRLLCFIAFTITCFVCLLLYFSSAKSRLVNAVTAALKLLLLLAVFIAGCIYLAKHGDRTSNWSKTLPGEQKFGWSQGLLLVFFSFHGWENATFVAGEIPKYEVLRSGFITAVLTVGILYISLVAVFCSAYDPSNADNFQNYMALFFGNTDRAKQAAAILTALSSTGSMISVAYTAVRVKQIIGWTNILPLSSLWRRTDLSRKIRSLLPRSGRDAWTAAVDQAVAIRKGTPEGGLIMHFISSITFICVTQAITDVRTAINFFGSVLIYGHFFFEAIVGIGYALFFEPASQGSRMIPDTDWKAPNPPKWLTKNRIGLRLLGGTTASISILIIAIELVKAPGWWYMAINVGVIVLAAVYWYLFVRLKSGSHSYRLLGLNLAPQVHGVDDTNSAIRQCSLCARHSHAQEHRHREDGYLEYNSAGFADTPAGNHMASLFGGFDETEERYILRPGAGAPSDSVPLGHVRKRMPTITVDRGGVASATDSGTDSQDQHSFYKM